MPIFANIPFFHLSGKNRVKSMNNGDKSEKNRYKKTILPNHFLSGSASSFPRLCPCPGYCPGEMPLIMCGKTFSAWPCQLHCSYRVWGFLNAPDKILRYNHWGRIIVVFSLGTSGAFPCGRITGQTGLWPDLPHPVPAWRRLPQCGRPDCWNGVLWPVSFT